MPRIFEEDDLSGKSNELGWTIQMGLNMDIKEAIRSRRSIRKYKDEQVPHDKLVTLLEMARLAPSAGNRQPWEFIVVRDETVIRRIAEGCRSGGFLSECPVIIVGCGDFEARPKWFALDTFIAMEHIALTSVGEGLGTCWIGYFDEDEIRRLLEIPENLRVVALMGVGFADDSPAPKERKPLEEFVSYERWGEREP